MHTIAIAHDKAVYFELQRRMKELEPDIDESTLNDTLEGLSDLPDAIGAVVRSALEDEAMVAGLKLRMDALKERLVRLQERGSRKRELARSVMEEAELKKIVQPDFSVSLRPANPGVVITDEDAIADIYWVPQPARLDRRLILEELKRGIAIAGAELSNTQLCLAVRTK